MNADLIKDAITAAYSTNGHAVFREFRTLTGFAAAKFIDVVAVGLWRRTEGIKAFEVKVTRGDFMGDVGSGYLGFTIGTLSIISEGLGGPPFWIWAVLTGVFITDATLTLIRRIAVGEHWREPHRSHVYQLAVQAGYSHRKVTSLVFAANLGLTAICILSLGRLSSKLITVAPFAALTVVHIMLYNRWREGAGDSSLFVGRSMHHSG